jgi:hypothetical protein
MSGVVAVSSLVCVMADNDDETRADVEDEAYGRAKSVSDVESEGRADMDLGDSCSWWL